MYKFDFYLAGPFFNEEQRQRMDAIKSCIVGSGLSVADPRELGPIIVDSAEERKTPEFFKAIFKGNIDGIQDSFGLIACLDDKDIGTAFELGFAYASSPNMPIISITLSGRGTNVMLSQSVDGHFDSLEGLSTFLKSRKEEITNRQTIDFSLALRKLNKTAKATE